MTTTSPVLDTLRAHGAAAYPEEGCGFLLGHATPEGNHVRAALAVENRQAENRARRYTISADDYRAADRTARQRGLDVVGFYHSHPDHPARPSATDLAEATFPGYTYVIVAVARGTPAAVTAWRLAPDRTRFLRESIDLTPEHASTP